MPPPRRSCRKTSSGPWACAPPAASPAPPAARAGRCWSPAARTRSSATTRGSTIAPTVPSRSARSPPSRSSTAAGRTGSGTINRRDAPVPAVPADAQSLRDANAEGLEGLPVITRQSRTGGRRRSSVPPPAVSADSPADTATHRPSFQTQRATEACMPTPHPVRPRHRRPSHESLLAGGLAQRHRPLARGMDAGRCVRVSVRDVR